MYRGYMVEDSSTQNKKISVAVSSALLERIDSAATQAGKARSEYVRDVIDAEVAKRLATNHEKFSVALSSALLSELDMVADLEGTSRSGFVRELLESMLD